MSIESEMQDAMKGFKMRLDDQEKRDRSPLSIPEEIRRRETSFDAKLAPLPLPATPGAPSTGTYSPPPVVACCLYPAAGVRIFPYTDLPATITLTSLGGPTVTLTRYHSDYIGTDYIYSDTGDDTGFSFIWYDSVLKLWAVGDTGSGGGPAFQMNISCLIVIDEVDIVTFTVADLFSNTYTVTDGVTTDTVTAVGGDGRVACSWVGPHFTLFYDASLLPTTKPKWKVAGTGGAASGAKNDPQNEPNGTYSNGITVT